MPPKSPLTLITLATPFNLTSSRQVLFKVRNLLHSSESYLRPFKRDFNFEKARKHCKPDLVF